MPSRDDGNSLVTQAEGKNTGAFPAMAKSRPSFRSSTINPLAIRGAFKKPFTGRADVVLTFGFRFWSGEHFGRMPTWNDKAKYIQCDPTPSRIGWQVPAEIPLVGDPKLVLRQMINRIKELKLDFIFQDAEELLKQSIEGAERIKKIVADHPDDRDALLAVIAFARDAGDLAVALDYARRLAQIAPDDQSVKTFVENLQRQVEEPAAR